MTVKINTSIDKSTTRMQNSNLFHAHLDELLITLSPLIGHTGQVGVPLLTVATNHAAVVELVLTEVALWVVVAVNVDLGQGIVSGGLLHSLMDTGLKQRQKKLQPVTKMQLPSYAIVQCSLHVQYVHNYQPIPHMYVYTSTMVVFPIMFLELLLPNS